MNKGPTATILQWTVHQDPDRDPDREKGGTKEKREVRGRIDGREAARLVDGIPKQTAHAFASVVAEQHGKSRKKKKSRKKEYGKCCCSQCPGNGSIFCIAFTNLPGVFVVLNGRFQNNPLTSSCSSVASSLSDINLFEMKTICNFKFPNLPRGWFKT